MEASNIFALAARGRWAVAAMFLANGFVVGSWAPQIPLLMARLAIDESTLGLLILGFGAGALCAMAWCGYLLSRFGSRPVLRGFALAASFSLLAVVLSPNVALAALTLFLFGGLIGGMDVAMNANAVAVERRLGRAIMSSSHGFWSLGGFAGAGLGGVAIQSLGATAHAVAVTALSLAVVAAALGHLVAESRPETHEPRRFSLPRQPAIYLVGLIALFSMVPEGAVLDWAALYLRQELGSGIAAASFAFAAFSAAMALTRFAGDRIRNRFGAVATLRFSSLIAAAGMAIAGFAPLSWLAIAGFALSGFGIANTVPIAFSAAGNQPAMSAGAGLSTVTLMGYSGILVAPSAIGFIGEYTGFAAVFIALALLLLCVSLMAGLAEAADDIRSERDHPSLLQQ
jgi:predicted MFS family arabinose efflux permease